MIDILYLLFFTLTAFFLGYLVSFFFIRRFNSLSEIIFISIALGIGIFSLLTFLLGLFGLYYKNLIRFILIIIFIPSFLFYLRKNKLTSLIRNLQPYKLNFYELTFFIIFVFYLLFNLIRDATPVLNGDSLAAYLEIPKIFVENHKISETNLSLWGYIPLNIHMLSILGILLSSDILAQLIVGWLTALLSSLAIYILAKNFVNKKIAIFSAIIFYSLPTLSWLIYSTKVDIGYTLFELSFWIFFVKWLKNDNKKYLFLSSIFLGFAIGSKYHSLITLFFANIVIIFVLIKKKKILSILRDIFLFSLIALIVASPSYIRNFVDTGDPFFPFITNPKAGGEEHINHYKGIFDYLKFQYNVIFGKNFFLRKYNFMDKPIGFLPILFIPFIFLSRQKNSFRKKILIIFFAFYFFLSFIIYKSVFPYPRHFLPAIGLLVVLNSIGMKNIFSVVNQKLINLLLIFSIFPTIIFKDIGFSHRRIKETRYQIKYIFGKLDKTDYLKKTLFNNGIHMNYPMIKYISTMPQKSKIITLDYGNAYYIPRLFVKKNYVYQIQNFSTLLNRLKRDNITHLYFNKPIMKKYVKNWQNGKQSVLIDSLNTGHFSLEKQSENQFLYKINY